MKGAVLTVSAHTLTAVRASESGVPCVSQVPQASQPACANAAACDPRIARSRQALRTALIQLIEERGLDGFSVNDLCQRAGLNRGTFYNHFHDKEQLLVTFEDEVLAGLSEFPARMKQLEIADLVHYRLHKEPLPALVDMFSYLRAESEFLHAIVGPGGDVRFGPRLREVACEGFVRSLLHERYQHDETPFLGYYIAYFAGAHLSVIIHWIQTGMKETPEEMAQIAMRLFFIKPGESIRL